MNPITLPANLSHEQLAAVLERHMLGALGTITLLGTHTLQLNDAVVLRIDDPQQPSVRKLAAIYGRLHASDLPAPPVLALDMARDVVPHNLLLMGYVPGVSAATEWPQLPQAACETLAEQLGRMVAAIHNLTWPNYGTYDLAHDAWGTHSRWNDALLQRLVVVVQQVQATQALPPRIVDGVVTALSDGESILDTASPPALCHGALDWGNVRIAQHDGAWRIALLGQWDAAWLADSAWEWAQLWLDRTTPYPDPDCFSGGYKEIRQPQPDRRARTHFYRLLIYTERALAAHASGDHTTHARYEARLLRLLRA